MILVMVIIIFQDIDNQIRTLMESIGFVEIELECKDQVFLFSDEQTRTSKCLDIVIELSFMIFLLN